ncbi:MAG: galactokinase family protein, partial [Bifidobacteriaceae bacterium]|nr:galactokinase family protein [Bifidobacteriaceae bacterium]
MTEPHFITAWTPAEGIRRVTDGFQRLFGEPPAGVWMSPGRVNLIGEHTDYNGGLSLPVALPQATFLAARVAPAPGDVA